MNKAQLKPRRSRTAVTSSVSKSWPWGLLIAGLLALVCTLGAISFSRALRSKKSREKIVWARVSQAESSEDSETEHLP